MIFTIALKIKTWKDLVVVITFVVRAMTIKSYKYQTLDGVY